MAVVSLEEMKNYLRVDFDDDDALLEGIIVQSQQICMDVARFTDLEEFEKQPVSKIAVMYAVALELKAYDYMLRFDKSFNG